MKITNSITGEKEEFISIEKNKIKMYACGITVYDLSHIGHARQAVVYAMMADYFRYKGYNVTYVRNYTDVDDKIINKANEIGENALEFSKKQIEETELDMKNLHITDATIKPKASEYIQKIIEFIEGLIKSGYAYSTEEGNVYFSVRKFKEYGKLSHRNIHDLISGIRIEIDKDKKEPCDFALWKKAKENEIFWKSPWGNGRPGWHIECSTMALDTLGETIDIHGGGKDLLFPHHENEIAQSEALTGKKFCNYWTHCGLIKINGEKMSKSLGNSLTIREVLNEYNYEIIKYVMLSKHYTSDIDISDEDFKIAESHMYYFYKTINKMENFVKNNDIPDCKVDIVEDEIINSFVDKFNTAMDDDFNTVLAISNLHILFKHLNNIMDCYDKNKLNTVVILIKKILDDLKNVYSILGLFTQESNEFINEIKSKYMNKWQIDLRYIGEKIAERLNAKSSKDYDKADQIRNELEEKGIILKDMSDGTIWDIKI